MGAHTKSHDSDHVIVRGKAKVKDKIGYVKIECEGIPEMHFAYFKYFIFPWYLEINSN